MIFSRNLSLRKIPLLNLPSHSLTAVPSERTVVNKERLSGSYRLSAYYLAKCLSELPLALVLPSAAFLIFYTMAGLNGLTHVASFFATWAVILTVAVTAQSIGEFLGVSKKMTFLKKFCGFLTFT